MEEEECVYFCHMNLSVCRAESRPAACLTRTTCLLCGETQFRCSGATYGCHLGPRRSVLLPREAPPHPGSGDAALLAGPGSDGVVVTWKDNFDSFYSEVAELGRYGLQPRAPSGRVAWRT